MENDVFSVLARKVLGSCESSLLGEKHSEYTRQKDRFHNFKSAGNKRGKHPIDILLDYQIKHTVSIEDICEDAMNGIYPTDKKLLEKIKDHINYNVILFGMITELRQEARMDAMAEENRTMGPGEEIQTITSEELRKHGQGLHAYGDDIPVGCYGKNRNHCPDLPTKPASSIPPGGFTLTADMLPGINNHSHHHMNCMGHACVETLPGTDSNPLLDIAYQRDTDLHETIKNTINRVNSGLSADKQTGDI